MLLITFIFSYYSFSFHCREYKTKQKVQMWFFVCENYASEPEAAALVSHAEVHNPCYHAGDGKRWKDLKGMRQTKNELGPRVMNL